METQTGALAALSDEIATNVERVAGSVVAVEGGGRWGTSGFFFRDDLIVTAAHGVDGDEVEIVRAGGTPERAAVAGRDAGTDVALLRLDPRGSAALGIAGSAPKVGAIALAVARDDDGDVHAAMGVVSAVGEPWRTWRGGEIDRWVRPDLALTPRFSGSPLLDARGRFLGMNTWGLSRRQAVTVPVATIERVVEALLSRGRVARGYLGVALQRVALPNDGGTGAIVLGLERSGPAERGGLFVGDIIVALDGERVEDSDDVSARLGSTSVGRAVRVGVIRGGSPHEVSVTVGERTEQDDD